MTQAHEVNVRRAGLATLGLCLALIVPQAVSASEKGLARRFAKAAARAEIQRVAVLPFEAVDGSDAREGRLLAEQLTGRLAERSEVMVVERSLLEHVMREARLGRTGALDESKLARLGRLLQAQALVVGTFSGAGGSVRLEARLVAVETGAILSAGAARLERETFSPAANLFVPSTAITADAVAAEMIAYANGEEAPRDAVADTQWPSRTITAAEAGSDCRDAARKADALQSSVLELKARYWAAQARKPGFSAASLRVKPGATILDPELRARFVSLMRRHVIRPGLPLSENEVQRFIAADGDAFRLLVGCGLVKL